MAVPALAAATAVAAPASALEAPVAFISNASPTYQTNGIAWAVAQAQGRVFVGGAFSSVRPGGVPKGTGEKPRTNLVVLDAVTGEPTSCKPTVTGSGAQVRSLAVSPDGRTLYLGGTFTAVAGVSRTNLAALDIATCAVVGFAPRPAGIVRTIAATSSTVYYGGNFTAVSGQSRGRAAASSTAGTLLPWSPRMDQDVRALAVRPDGSSVVVGGDFDTVGGAPAHGLVVVDPTAGSVVRSFGSLVPALSDVHELTADAQGFYTGHEGHGTGVFDGRIAIEWGSWATRWKDDCLGATQALVVYSGVLYSGSHAHDCSAEGEFPDGIRHHLLAQSTSGPSKLSWFPDTNGGLGEALGPRDMVVAPSGSGSALWVVGEFTTVNGVSQTGITRFGQGRDTAGPTAAATAASSNQAGQVRVTFRPAIDTDDSTLTYRVYRNGGSTPVWTTSASAKFWRLKQVTYADTAVTPGSTYTYRVDASDGTTTTKGSTRSVTVARTSSPYVDRVRADGASQLWRFDEDSTALVADALPVGANGTAGANGTLLGTATSGVAGALLGEADTARTLTGSSSTIYSASPVPWTSSSQALTLETWIKTTTTSGGKIIGMGNKQEIGSSLSDKQIYLTDAGKLSFGVQSGGAQRVTSPGTYNDGKWHHVAATLGSGGMALYVDGGLVASNAAVTKSATYAQGYWRVGGDTLNEATWSNAPTSAYYRGTLDETAVYPTALSAATIRAHYALSGR